MFAVNAIFACDISCSHDTHMRSKQQCFTLVFLTKKRKNTKNRYINF